MESCRVTYLCVSSVGTNSQHETKLIPTTVIVRLVDAHFACEQTNDKCDRGDDSMPESGPKTSRLGTRLLVSGVRPSDGEDICHNWGVSVSPPAPMQNPGMTDIRLVSPQAEIRLGLLALMVQIEV